MIYASGGTALTKSLKPPQPPDNNVTCMDLFSTSNMRRLKYTLGIWAPDADKITEQCREAFHKNIPFACLVPNDLVEYIAMDNKGQLDKQVAAQVEAAFKITLLSAGLTWIVHGVDFSKCQPPIKTVHQRARCIKKVVQCVWLTEL